MPRFRNIPGGVEDLDTGLKWRLGRNVDRTQPAAVSEVDNMPNYEMPTFSELQELNTASVEEMNSCNLAVFVGKRIWSETGCTSPLGSGFQNIDLGDEGDDQCEVASMSSNHRAMGRK